MYTSIASAANRNSDACTAYKRKIINRGSLDVEAVMREKIIDKKLTQLQNPSVWVKSLDKNKVESLMKVAEVKRTA